MSASQSSPVKSALRTLEVIEFVVAHPGGVVARDIANGLDIPLSSLSYLLATLTEREYLSREGRRYSGGPALDRLRTDRANLSLEDRVAPLVRALAAELDETASFMVREDWQARIVASRSSAQALRYAIAPGETKPLHVLAGGKAILSQLSDAQLEAYFDETRGQRECLTEHTIVSPAALRKQIATFRDQGYATAMEESTAGISSIARPVRLGDVDGAFSIAVPSIRFLPELQNRAQSALARAVASLHVDR
ncbi:IclR family transcriptional regulator [Citromicrobium sp. JLT1363]|uniref:IclR family transcriptional regulator n=1 Tax=Citromicrobium sp. JLT1363 TaxID=517722 RepID=UPI0002EE6FA7|nr:IclR family transcriptional regulator [Citromicrobium sp. JLT1363]